MTTPEPPSIVIRSPDGTTIAVFTTGVGPPLLLLHGTAGSHSTFRVIGPRLDRARTLHAIDRRGRGASGDTAPYTIAREFEDLVAVAEHVAAETGRAVDMFGHSYGGRVALGAALRTDAIRRVISYEAAPPPPGSRYLEPDLQTALSERLVEGDHEAVLATFMRQVVGMTQTDLEAYRADPVWPVRVAAAATIVRELAAETDREATLDVLGEVRQPVLQVLGGAGLPVFRAATDALHARLRDGQVVEIPGAGHAAHHTHPDALVNAIISFLRD